MISDPDIDYYLSEGCGQFAVALAKFFPESRIALLCNQAGEAWSEDFPHEATHACVLIDEQYIDARGVRTLTEILDEFAINKEDLLILPYSPARFQSECMGDDDWFPLYGNQQDVLASMKKIVQANFLSTLPNGLSSSAQSNLDAQPPEP